MTSFKVKLLRALGTTNTAPLPPKKINVEVRLDHVWPWPNVLDQGGARGGAIAVKKSAPLGGSYNCTTDFM